jgi:hypothetical protein
MARGGAREGSGPKPKEIDLGELEKLAKLQCTDQEIAAFFGVSTRTIENRRKEDEVFRDTIDRGRQTGLISLRRAQFGAALKGNPTMLVWMGKQLLNQKDKIANEMSGPEGKPITFTSVKELTDEQLGTMLAQLEAGTGNTDSGGTGSAETPKRIN